MDDMPSGEAQGAPPHSTQNTETASRQYYFQYRESATALCQGNDTSATSWPIKVPDDIMERLMADGGQQPHCDIRMIAEGTDAPDEGVFEIAGLLSDTRFLAAEFVRSGDMPPEVGEVTNGCSPPHHTSCTVFEASSSAR